MVKQSRKTKEGWILVDEMVRRWMQQRVQLTQDYASILAPKSLDEDTDKLVLRLSTFCQTLVDYVSAGHFEIYNELITEAREFDDGSLATGINLFKSISRSTDLALEFNDRYESVGGCRQRLDDLAGDLVELGNVLNSRFELEDQLIQAVHDCHRSLVA